jgi:hypothetical protein
MHNLHGRGAGVFVRLGALAMIMALGCGDDEPPPTDHPPTIDDASVTTPEDTPVAIALVAVDVDGDEVTIAVAPPSTGEVTVSGHTVTYTPASDFAGTVTLAATATAGGASDTATLTITVTPVNDPPVAVDDVRAAAEDQPQSIPEAMLTANDSATPDARRAHDHRGHPARAPAAPWRSRSGNVTYAPAANFNGDATPSRTRSATATAGRPPPPSPSPSSR